MSGNRTGKCPALTKQGSLCSNGIWRGHEYCYVHSKREAYEPYKMLAAPSRRQKDKLSPYAIAGLVIAPVMIGFGILDLLRVRGRTKREKEEKQIAEDVKKVAQLGYDAKLCGIIDEKGETEPFTNLPWSEMKHKPVIRLQVQGETHCFNYDRLFQFVKDARRNQQAKVTLPGVTAPGKKLLFSAIELEFILNYLKPRKRR